MPESSFIRIRSTILPVCSICFLYLCSFFLFAVASNSLVYSTVCLLKTNESFCSQIDQNRTLNDLEEEIQKESSQWCLYGTLAFGIIACFVSPIYGSLSDTRNRKLPIVLTISNAVLSGTIVTIGSVFRGSKIALILYLVTNVVNGFGGGGLILISSCFGYATDSCSSKEQTVQTIALIEASLSLGVVASFLVSTFMFETHGPVWHILLIHLILLCLALFISLLFLKAASNRHTSETRLCDKIIQPLVDSQDLIVKLKRSSLLKSFLLLLISLFFYEIYRMGSSSVVYLYLHNQSFDDTRFAAFFTIEQTASCLALVLLALLRRKLKLSDLHLSVVGLCLSSVGLFLFAFARKNQMMLFGAIPSSMFTIYFPVCLRAMIARLVPERDKGKAFSFVALIQNLDVVIGTVACVKIYQATISIFSGAVFIFAVGTRFLALLLILIGGICYGRSSDIAVGQPIDDDHAKLDDAETDANSDDEILAT